MTSKQALSVMIVRAAVVASPSPDLHLSHLVRPAKQRSEDSPSWSTTLAMLISN